MRKLRPSAHLLLLLWMMIIPLQGMSPAQAQWFDWLFRPKPAPPPVEGKPPSRTRRINPEQQQGVTPRINPPIQNLSSEQELALLKLSETLGALASLARICPKSETSPLWEHRMETLLASDGDAFGLREKMIGAYNHGYLGYATTFRQCTNMALNAQLTLKKEVAKQAQLVQQIL